MRFLRDRDPYKVYIYTNFLSALIFTFIFTVNLLYHVQIVRLDPLQLVLVGTVLELTVFLFEIPTGVVADLKSRKLSIIIGYFLIGSGFLIEGLFPLFVTVIISQVLWGIGYTFTSGAQQAWIADEIGEKEASAAFVKGARAGNLGRIIAIPLSIGVGYFMVNLPILLGGIGMLLLAVLLIRYMKEENFYPANKEERDSTWSHLKKNMKNIIRYSKASFLLRILFLIALLFGLYSEGFDRLWMTHFIDAANLSKFTDSQLVIFMGAIEFVIVLFSFITLHLISRSTIYERRKQIYIALFIGSFIIISSLLGFAFSTLVIGLLVFYMLIQICRHTMEPLVDVWLNQLIVDSKTRASFFSVKGQIDAIGQISGGPVIGLIATKLAIRTAFVCCAILLSPVLVLYYLIVKKDKDFNNKTSG
ncbi:MFS transporter [Ornithinibacillus bavariensis]|uniref:Tetracycline efflux MFS transporter TetA(P) n=1 Tax=Ornithinibacillus bavariensis TaxID=545502 RepID=A0A919X6B8_9BACI|nr:MFS transporter [Ornithinibacillus bavariensis]GIO26554.1 tetracycline efflux MFS transporter TetA(P) [Ornithinibacillus bavariensis]